MVEELIEKIKQKKIKVSIIGLGYVGLPLAVEFLKKGFEVIGIDKQETKVQSLKEGISYIEDVPSKYIKENLDRFRVSASYTLLKDADAIIICVPTPLGKSKEPDISFVLDAVDNIEKYLKKGSIVVLESTTYPGTTENILKPILQKRGLKAGEDFFLAFSPERVDPANKKYNISNTPKVVGGINDLSTEVVAHLYSHIVSRVVKVSSPAAAETVKLLENTFRAINIGLVNELAMLTQEINLDIWEIIEAASTKPFGFMKFYPGPGIGGHCIPIDPLYLSWYAKLVDFRTEFIELADYINSRMHKVVLSLIVKALNYHKKSVNNSNILILGIAYKPDVSDARESPAINLIKDLCEYKANITIYDPYVKEITINENKKFSSIKDFSYDSLSNYDLVVLLTNHSIFDYKAIVEKSKLIVDTRGVLRQYRDKQNIFILGIGKSL